ncbi:hypothetical protein [Streptomyces sp. NPDC059533]|uniref:hypothetical protein n=1 Tax=unclassified Streptomyces TaxID=2593676 RepID=UPI0036AA3131
MAVRTPAYFPYCACRAAVQVGHVGDAPGPPYLHVGAWQIAQGPVWLGDQVTGWGLAGVAGVVMADSWAIGRRHSY